MGLISIRGWTRQRYQRQDEYKDRVHLGALAREFVCEHDKRRIADWQQNHDSVPTTKCGLTAAIAHVRRGAPETAALIDPPPKFGMATTMPAAKAKVAASAMNRGATLKNGNYRPGKCETHRSGEHGGRRHDGVCFADLGLGD